jgi:hypothetical protein
VDDQIWEATLGGGDPPALGFQTTFGLRARGMRLFPTVVVDGEHCTDPGQFAAPLTLREIFPNYLRVDFRPKMEIGVSAEFWVAESQMAAGRFVVRNEGDATKRVRLALNVVFHPGEHPRPIRERVLEGVTVLAGETDNLAPVIFMAGGAALMVGPYPALAVTQELEPGASKSVIWAEAAMDTPETSFVAARALAARPWDAEVARVELANAAQVELETGDAEWDWALAMAQKVSLGSYVGPTRRMPHPALVLSRAPDRGFSRRGDGRDYTLHWDGHDALEAYYNVLQILPAAPDLAKGLVRNFLAAASADGSIDARPGPAGQRSGSLYVPLLATTAWEVYQATQDRAFLEECYPRLVRALEAWFSPEHDRDQDGFPEWDHTSQAGFHDWPAFVRWREWGQGLDLAKAETPDLASYLHRELTSLIEASRLLEAGDIPGLEARRTALRAALESSWNPETACYCHRDRDVHATPRGGALGSGQGEFELAPGREFDPPVRVLVRSYGVEGESHRVEVEIHGRGPQGKARVERLGEDEFQWFWNRGTATSDLAFSRIERIRVRGLAEVFATELLAGDYSRQDVTHLLPLWAGIPDGERAERLIKATMLDPKRYWRPGGIPMCPASDPAYDDGVEMAGGVFMLWNAMLGEGLVRYGFRREAAELFTRLMQGPLAALRAEGVFRECYRADAAEGAGERNHIAGVPPISLFLRVLGVRLLAPHRVLLEGSNPFPWPVTVRWRGLEVRREPAGATVITFPDGQRVSLEGEEARAVEETHNESGAGSPL